MALTLVNNNVNNMNMNINCSMDEFQRIFIQIEKRLMIDLSDPISDFRIIEYWIDNINNNNNNSDNLLRYRYFLNDVIPKITKAIMIRSYSSIVYQIFSAKKILKSISSLIGSSINMIDIDGLHKYLPEFFDSSNIFYTKYDKPNDTMSINNNDTYSHNNNHNVIINDNYYNMSNIITNNINSEMEKDFNHNNIESSASTIMPSFNDFCFLDNGETIDCRRSKNGKWSVATVTSISNDKRKIKVQFIEDDLIEEIDLNKDPDRVAPFMAKVGSADNNVICIDDNDEIPDLIHVSNDHHDNSYPKLDSILDEPISFEGIYIIYYFVNFTNH